MQNMSKVCASALDGLGTVEHIASEPGDFVAADGYLHCGKCKQRKEFRIPFNGHMVPSLCACGKAERAREEREAQRRQALARVSELASYSLIDKRFRESTFDKAIETPDNAEAFRIARKYCENWPLMLERNVGLIFYGPPGTGKTFLSACIANELMRQTVPVLATSLVKLGNVDAESLEEILHRMRSAELVILDDFGAERGTEYMKERIFSVIDSRYGNKKPLIVTSNLDLAKMGESTDIGTMRVYERIRAMCKVVNLRGKSWRQREAEALFD